MHPSFRWVAGLLILLLTRLPAEEPTVMPADWTMGTKKVLLIRCAFTDVTANAQPTVAGGWDGLMGEVAARLGRSSYGKLALTWTITDVVTIPKPSTVYAEYVQQVAGTPAFTKTRVDLWSEPGSVFEDVQAAARLANPVWDCAHYDLVVFVSRPFPAAPAVTTLGHASPGLPVMVEGGASGTGKTVWMHVNGTLDTNGGADGTFTAMLPHELGHALGLAHARLFMTSTVTEKMSTADSATAGGPIERDYTDLFDTMGRGFGRPDGDFNVASKYKLGWMQDEHVLSPTTSGIYRILAYDQGSLPTLTPAGAGAAYALRFPHGEDTYWLSHRGGFADNPWQANGIEIHLGPTVLRNRYSYLIDTTPFSHAWKPTGFHEQPTFTWSDANDAPLVVGRTFSEPTLNLHITPLAKIGTAPEAIDVQVNQGPFPGNRVPVVPAISASTFAPAVGTAVTFQVSGASDPDGDALAYSWESDIAPDSAGRVLAIGGDQGDARLCTAATRTWTAPGVYIVRCTVTDMKGGQTTVSAKVTVGTPTGFTITGTVRDELAKPIRGAVVTNWRTTPATGVTAFTGETLEFSTTTDSNGVYTLVNVPSGTSVTLNVKHLGWTFTTRTLGAVTGNKTGQDFTRTKGAHTSPVYAYVGGLRYTCQDDHLLFSADTTVMDSNDGLGTVTSNMGGANLPTQEQPTVFGISLPAGYTAKALDWFPAQVNPVDNVGRLWIVDTHDAKTPRIGFASAGITSNDQAGNLLIPVVLTLPAPTASWPAANYAYDGTNWPADLGVRYWVDPSSTAVAGVDYLLPGGSNGGFEFWYKTPTLRQDIPLKILPTGGVKTKTLILRLAPALQFTALSPVATFTYTITNPPDLVGSFVDRLYRICLERAPDAGGLANWIGALKEKRLCGAEAGRAFLLSQEFRNRNLPDGAFIDILYQTCLGRAADAGGRATWLGELARGVQREDVMDGFLFGQEFANISTDAGIAQSDAGAARRLQVRAFVLRFYRVCLGREPDEAGAASWTASLLDGSNTGGSLAQGFTGSQEQANRNQANAEFVDMLYRTFFDRVADAGGRQVWLDALAAGKPRSQVVEGFIHAQEFLNLCARFAIVPFAGNG